MGPETPWASVSSLQNEAEALQSFRQHPVPLGSARAGWTPPSHSPRIQQSLCLSSGKQEGQEGAAEGTGRKLPRSGETCPNATLMGLASGEPPGTRNDKTEQNSLRPRFESHLSRFLAVRPCIGERPSLCLCFPGKNRGKGNRCLPRSPQVEPQKAGAAGRPRALRGGCRGLAVPGLFGSGPGEAQEVLSARVVPGQARLRNAWALPASPAPRPGRGPQGAASRLHPHPHRLAPRGPRPDGARPQ